MDFEVRRDAFDRTRFVDADPPRLGGGDALLATSRFGLTTNNITYVVFGDAMSYWDFFPASEEGWGRMPVWGFADVVASEAPGLEPGRRVYGYLPASTHLRVRPDRLSDQGFTDATPHRTGLPAVYNRYAFTDADPRYDAAREDEQLLLEPLFGTAFLLDDELGDEGLDELASVILSSASSKTALATAFLLSRREGPEIVGLTSPSRVDFVAGTGAYDRVLPYGDAGSLGGGPAAYLEFSGNADVRASVHRHFGDRLLRSTLIGATHRERIGGGGELPGPEPVFFFAPDRVAKRTADWGGAGLRERIATAWGPFVAWTDGWLEIRRSKGLEALESAYLEMLDGAVDPATGRVFELPFTSHT